MLRSSFLVLGSLLLATLGCQPAGRYTSKPPPRPTSPSTAKVDEPGSQADGLLWQAADPLQLEPDVPIRFVHEGTQQAEWNRLPGFWNPAWQRPVLALGPPALAAAGLGYAGELTPVIRIKVPLGLDDPSPRVPAVNPLTLNKWRLGKDLFFDDQVLLQRSEKAGFSCARCHHPAAGYTDPRASLPVDTPTLINCVYNRRQFWDGRAEALEQAVQLEPGDESTSQRFHSWPGVVERLRKHPDYPRRFREVFGTEPTQDAVGKAIATYLRTILAANSVQDRAEKARRDRGGMGLLTADYEKSLSDADLRVVAWEHGDRPSRAELAQELLKGHHLFHGQAGCVHCHSGPTYSDGGFHNLAAGDRRLSGRFATAPLGEKGLHLIGAVKTPGLRALPRTAPFFHSGRESVLGRSLDETLFQVVVWHVKEAPNRRPSEPYLDPLIQPCGLKEDEVRSLVVYLKALAGQPVAEVVADRQQ